MNIHGKQAIVKLELCFTNLAIKNKSAINLCSIPAGWGPLNVMFVGLQTLPVVPHKAVAEVSE